MDPGTRATGYGVIDSEGSRLRFVAAGVIRAAKDAPLETRLAGIAREFDKIVATHHPDEAGVEDVFVKLNPRSALAVGHARGALLSVLGARDVPVFSLPPASVKRSVAGNGQAAKTQVARMVGVILGHGQELTADATDALAVAIAHALGLKRRQLATEDGTR